MRTTRPAPGQGGRNPPAPPMRKVSGQGATGSRYTAWESGLPEVKPSFSRTLSLALSDLRNST